MFWKNWIIKETEKLRKDWTEFFWDNYFNDSIFIDSLLKENLK